MKITHLRLALPVTVEGDHRQEFFLGAWHPFNELHLDRRCLQADNLSIVNHRNWFLLGSRSSLHGGQPGLVHAPDKVRGHSSPVAVAFRGYVLDPPIHSYSGVEAIISYWSRHPSGREHNGVFASVCIRDFGRLLELHNDAFGMSPLYYRLMGGLVLFATNPRYLSVNGDQPDLLAWRSLIQTGFIIGNRTLSQGIWRLAPGSVFTAREDSIRLDPWIDLGSLGAGTAAIDTSALARVEKAFQEGFDRVLALRDAEWFLPLSSGHDSRRLLASLMDRKEAFESATVRVPGPGFRDLDAPVASDMARDLGFPHKVLQCTIGAYAQDDACRRRLMDCESMQHTWAMTLFRSLPATPVFLLDGLAGDVLGNSGFVIPGLHECHDRDKTLIAGHCVGDEYDSSLNASVWPGADELRGDVLRIIGSLPQGPNQSEWAFLLLHTRRDIALWSQFLLPRGHVTVCPFLELGFVREVMKYDPSEKHRVFLQTACLREFWPKYCSYPGSRRIPGDAPPGSPRFAQERALAVFNQRLRELEGLGGRGYVHSLLTPTARLKLFMARLAALPALRWSWALGDLLALAVRDLTRRPVWMIAEEGLVAESLRSFGWD